jgi:hypothetical protein
VSRSSVRSTSEAGKPPPALLRRGKSGCTSRWGLVPRRELPHSLRSTYAVSHDLGGLPLSGAVRHVSSGHTRGVWIPAGIAHEGFSDGATRRPSLPKLVPTIVPMLPGRGPPRWAYVRPAPWQARDAARVRPLEHSLPGLGPLPSDFAPDQVKTRPRLTRPVFPPGGRGDSRVARPKLRAVRSTPSGR